MGELCSVEKNTYGINHRYINICTNVFNFLIYYVYRYIVEYLFEDRYVPQTRLFKIGKVSSVDIRAYGIV